MKTKTQKARQTFQQGDVIGRRIESLPKTAKVISRGKCILAEGEHTGHAHVVEDDEAELLRDGERILLRLEKAAIVTHEEHKPIRLSPGIWEIGRVREYDYFAQMSRPVAD